ncbi:MAG TPA: hypothetical protein VFU43_22415 [Streptosporangiaceae bacterium]|nr:hypothetical protein [Streptosporangiaceae bacterium]
MGCSILAVSGILLAGCSQGGTATGQGGSAARPSTSPPKPAPALAPAEAKRTVVRWVAAFNARAKRNDVRGVAKLESGNLLEEHRTVLKLFQREKNHFLPLRATSDITIPKFTGWPKWFTATLTSKGYESTPDRLVFVQSAQGAPWQASMDLVLFTSTIKALGARAKPPLITEVVPAGDTSLLVAPGQLPGVHADVRLNGTKSRYARLFHTGKSTRGATTGNAHTAVKNTRYYFRFVGWSGRTAIKPARQVPYALRTRSGGALVFYAVEQVDAYKRVRGSQEHVWEGPYGTNVYPVLIGKEAAENRITRMSRTSYVAYVPPKGGGKVVIIGSLWSTVSAKGS